MPNRKECKKYTFTVEGETEKWYLDWLKEQINNEPEAKYIIKIVSDFRKNPLEYVKTVNPLSTPEITHWCDYESNDNISELIKDPMFENGFNVRGLSSQKDGVAVRKVFNYGNDRLKPFWVLAQWDSKYSFADSSVTDFKAEGNGVYKYTNPSKTLIIDTKQGILTLRELASECYDKPREAGESWPHLLIECAFRELNDIEKIKISTMNQLNIHFKTKLTYFKDCMGNEAQVNLHAGQFLLFLYIQNLSSRNEPGYGDKIWFGLPIFDTRYEFPPQYSGEDTGKEDASHQFIFNVDSSEFIQGSFWKDGKPLGSEKSEWVNTDVNILPFIQIAYNTARERGYLKDTDFNKLYVSGMNMGWELPGTYDVEMQVEKLGITVIR